MDIWDRLHVNSYSADDVRLARAHGLGLEIDCFMWTLDEVSTQAAMQRVPALVAGFSRLVMHGTGITPDFPEKGAMSDEALAAHYAKSLAIGAGLGVSGVVFHSSACPGKLEGQALVQRAVRLFRPLLAQTHLCIYLENLCDDSPDALVQICQNLGSDRFGICLDVGHANANSKVPLAAWVAACAPHLRHVHLHNNDGLKDGHLPLDQGTIPMADVLTQIEALARPTYTLECSAAASLAWLERIKAVSPPAGVQSTPAKKSNALLR